MLTPATTAAGARGFSLVELLVAMVVSLMVLGGAVMLTSQVQSGYTRQMEEAAAQQEGRYALEWISRLIRGAGTNYYLIETTDCPAAGTDFDAIIFDPDEDGVNNDIRLQADSNPPDGFLGGPAGTCTQANEDVTVSFDSDTSSITFLDNNLGGTASIRTDAVIDNILFIYRDWSRVVTTNPGSVVYVETQVTVRTRTINPSTGLPNTRTLSQEVRVRGRNY